jgi:hypothetical protein
MAKRMTVFDVEAHKPIAEVLEVPETSSLLVWNPKDRAFEVQNSCGFKDHGLTRTARRILRANHVASDFHKVGTAIQAAAAMG